jgi:protein phosphatase 1 regulatory subunit 37
VLHLENSNIQGRILLMLAAALKENEIVKEIYLGDNKMQPSDGQSICSIIKENKCLDILDLKNNNLQDTGLSHMCSGLSELGNIKFGLKGLYIANNNITSNGISYLSKALIHNRSLISLNISQNSLTNEAIYELKDALIVNKQISSLFLIKTKLTDEGVVALAEYIAETISLRRLDLRENDIRLGGLMALASSLKFNKTLSRLDLDREPKKEYSIRDSIETSRRLLKDISDFCMRNKREQLEYDAKQTELKLKQEEERKIKEIENEKKLVELFNELNEQLADSKASLNNTPNETYNDDESAKKCNLATERTEEDDECVDIINEDDELLKKILSRTTPSLHSPIKPNNDDLINYFNLVDKNYDEKLNKSNNLSNHSKENNYHRFDVSLLIMAGLFM